MDFPCAVTSADSARYRAFEVPRHFQPPPDGARAPIRRIAMTHSTRITCAAVGFTLITLVAADPGATATFSAWSTPLFGATINLFVV